MKLDFLTPISADKKGETKEQCVQSLRVFSPKTNSFYLHFSTIIIIVVIVIVVGISSGGGGDDGGGGGGGCGDGSGGGCGGSKFESVSD